MKARTLAKWVKRNATANQLRIVAVLLFLALALWGIVLIRYELVLGYSWWGLLLTTACTSVAPELAGIVIGVVTIDYLNERRQEQQLKEQLILQVGSRHNDVTDTAIRALRARGWLEDGSLKEADLILANLQGAYLVRVNLQGANLREAKLQEASLARANLQEANLFNANLEGAILTGANLERANLEGAILQNADLESLKYITVWREGGATYAPGPKTNLREANLTRANLEGARLIGTDLEEAILDGAIMPDGTKLSGLGNPHGPTFEEWAENQQKDGEKVDWDRVEAEIESVIRSEEEE